MKCVVKVTVQNSCQKYTHKFLSDEVVTMDLEDPRMKEMISEAVAALVVCPDAQGESLDIDVKINSKLQ